MRNAILVKRRVNVGTRINEHLNYLRQQKDTVLTKHLTFNSTHEIDFDNY